MKHENLKQNALWDALEDLKRLQDLLANSWSKYYGHYFTKLVGSDTIPCFLTTTECTLLRLHDLKSNLETSYFRLEEIEKSQQRITLSLLRAFDFEDNETNSTKDIARLEKTDVKVTVDLSSILAVQVLNPVLVGHNFYIESKW